MPGPNIVLLVFDTARADAFTPYGAPSDATPVVAQLANEGSFADAAYATSCWTLPSHASLFTGALPRAVDLAQAPGGTPHGCAPVLRELRPRLLPAVLREHGYRTEGVSTNLWITDVSGFDTGFDRFESVPSPRQGHMVATTPKGRARWLAEGVLARYDDGARSAEQTLERWLGDRGTEPFFWFVNLIECHSPYLPPRPYNDLPLPQRLKAASEAPKHLTLDAIWRSCCGGFDVPPDAIERMRHLYAQSIRLLDDWLGRIVERLGDAGVLDDTVVIVTSDHGENLGESELIGHAFSLDDRLTRVPLVARGPGIDVSGTSSIAQLPALIAEVASIEAPWSAGDLPSDVGVAQFDPPVEPGDPRIEIALEAWGLGEEAAQVLTTPLTSASDGRWKLLRRGEVEETYDLVADPSEEQPNAVIPDDRLTVLREALCHPAATARGTGTHGARTVPSTSSAPDPDEVARIEAQMRQLGYL